MKWVVVREIDLPLCSHSWLRSHVGAEGGRVEDLSDAVRVEGSADALARAFGTTLVAVREEGDLSGGAGVKFVGEFRVPSSVAPHVAMVTGLTELPPPLPRAREGAGSYSSSYSSSKVDADEEEEDNAKCNVPYTIQNAYSYVSNVISSPTTSPDEVASLFSPLMACSRPHTAANPQHPARPGRLRPRRIAGAVRPARVQPGGLWDGGPGGVAGPERTAEQPCGGRAGGQRVVLHKPRDERRRDHRSGVPHWHGPRREHVHVHYELLQW